MKYRSQFLAALMAIPFAISTLFAVNPVQDPPADHTGTIAIAYVDASGNTQQVSSAFPLPTGGGGGGGGGATGTVTAAGVNGTVAQAVQGINGGVPLSIVNSDVTSSGSITGSASLAVSTANRNTVAFQVTGTWTGTIQVEATVNGTDWISTTYTAIPSGNSASSFSANNGGQINCVGMNQIRLRAATISSGTANIAYVTSSGLANVMLDNPIPTGTNLIGAIRITDTGGNGITSSLLSGKQRLDVNLAAGGVPAATAPSWADQMAGVDGSGNLRPFSTDTAGRVNVNSNAALQAGSALVGKVTLNDGTNSQTILAASTATAPTNTAQVVAIRDTIEAIQPLVLVPPTVNTLSATGTVQAQIVPGGVYTFCISSASTLGATANTLASCGVTLNSTTVTYTGTAPSIGQLLGGTGITAGSYVVSVNAGVSFVMSLPANVTNASVTLNVTAGSFAGNFQSSPDGTTWTNINVIPMTFAINSAPTNSFIAPGLFRYVSTQKDNFLRINLTSIGSTGVLGNLSAGPSVILNIDAFDRNGGVINLPYVQYVAATASTFPSGIAALMPIDRTGLGTASLSITSLTGTGQTITWRQGSDSTGVNFLGLGGLTNGAAQNAVALTTTAGGEYLLAPSARYLSGPITGTATSAMVISGACANVGASQAATQSVNTINNQPINISQYGGQSVVTGGINGVAAVGGNVAHSGPTTANPVPTGGRVSPTTAATVDYTLIAGDSAWQPMTTGNQSISKAFATAELDWSAITSLTPTTWASAATLTQVRAASGTATTRTYVSALSIETDALGGATSLWLVDGAVAISSATVATPGVFTSGTHDFKIGDAIVLEGIATLAITGVSANQVVYVVTVPSTTTFTVALTPGGTGVQVTASGTATAYRILKQIRLQTTALPVTSIPLPSPIRSAPNVAISLLSSATQTGTVYVDTQGYYGF